MGLETHWGPRRPCHMEALLVAGPGTSLGGKACSLSAWLWVIPPRGSGSRYASTHLSHEPANVCPVHWPFPARSASSARQGSLICLAGTSSHGPIRPDLVNRDCPRIGRGGLEAEAWWLIWSEQMQDSFLPLVPRTGVRDAMNVFYFLASNPEIFASNSKQAIHFLR